MRLLKFIIVVFCFVASTVVVAQEGAVLMPMMQDSSQIEFERKMEYQQLISGQIPNKLMLEEVKLPEFDFNTALANRYTINSDAISHSSLPLTNFTSGLVSPFYFGGTVLSQAAYKVNDRFTFGGFSYEVNSLPTLAPPPGLNNFNRYGSTMFMQYKVGKNFKIETRVNVSQGGAHPGY